MQEYCLPEPVKVKISQKGRSCVAARFYVFPALLPLQRGFLGYKL